MLAANVPTKLLARNTLVNSLGFILSIGAAAFLIPWVVRGLGVDQFGIVAFGWTLLGYCGIFELGLSRSTTHLVSRVLGRGNTDQVPRIVWTSLVLQSGSGMLGAAIIWGLIPALVERFQVGSGTAGEAIGGLRILVVAIPVIAMTGTLRGLLEAGQQFVAVNSIGVLINLLNLTWPAVGATLGWDLSGIMGLLALTRLLALLAYGSVCALKFRLLRGVLFDARCAWEHVRYGGWVTVSAICVPLLVNCDRVALAVLSGAEAFAYYAAPQEIARRLVVIPASLTTVIFPALSLLVSAAKPDRVRKISFSALKYILLVSGFVTLLMVVYASDLLRLWLGPDFAAQGTSALRITCVGIFANSLAHVPYAVLHAYGYPRVTAMFHAFELLLQPLLAWWLVGTWGITGAAMAWSVWAILDAALLFAFAFKKGILPAAGYKQVKLTRAAVVLCVTALAIVALRTAWGSAWSEGLGLVSACVASVLVTWLWVFDANDRSAISGMWQTGRGMFREADGSMR